MSTANRTRDRMLSGLTHKVVIGGIPGFITANRSADGTLSEVFIHGFGSFGSTHQGWTDSFGILLSVAVLRADGVAFSRLRDRFARINFEPNGFTDNPDIPTCESIPDYIFKWLDQNFTLPTTENKEGSR